MASGSATKSYILPVSDLSIGERQALRSNVDQVLELQALRLTIAAYPDNLVIRDTLPNADLGLAAQDSWLVAGAGVVGTDLQYFNPTIAIDRVIGFWGIAPETVPISISRVRLTLGAASSEVRGVFQLEPLYSRLEPVGYFSEAVIFQRQELARIMIMPRTAFVVNSQVIPFLARTIEPLGAVVSRPSA